MGLIKVGNNKRILKTSEKAVCIDMGRTFDGKPITTWYPKSVIQTRHTKTGFDIFVPEWFNLRRICRIGDFDICNTALPEDYGIFDTESSVI